MENGVSIFPLPWSGASFSIGSNLNICFAAENLKNQACRIEKKKKLSTRFRAYRFIQFEINQIRISNEFSRLDFSRKKISPHCVFHLFFHAESPACRSTAYIDDHRFKWTRRMIFKRGTREFLFFFLFFFWRGKGGERKDESAFCYLLFLFLLFFHAPCPVMVLILIGSTLPPRL